MLRFLLSLVFIFSITYPILAQSGDSLIVSGRQMLQAGVNANDLDSMYAARATFERALADTGLAAWRHYYVALADYRIASLLGSSEESKDQASEHLKVAVEHLKKATEIDPQAAEAYSLLSSAYGLQIGLRSYENHALGSQSGKGQPESQAARPRQSARGTERGHQRL